MDEQDYVEDVANEVELPNFAYRDSEFENNEAPGSRKKFLIFFFLIILIRRDPSNLSFFLSTTTISPLLLPFFVRRGVQRDPSRHPSLPVVLPGKDCGAGSL